MIKTMGSQRMQYGLGLLAAMAMVTMIVLLMPASRLQVQSWFWPDEKELISTVIGDLLGTGETFEVLKFKLAKGLLLEVRQRKDDGNSELIDRAVIADRYNGYYDLAGQATPLALIDMNGDGHPEIIAPSFDERLGPHLNVFRLKLDDRRLEVVRSGTN